MSVQIKLNKPSYVHPQNQSEFRSSEPRSSEPRSSEQSLPNIEDDKQDNKLTDYILTHSHPDNWPTITKGSGSICFTWQSNITHLPSLKIEVKEENNLVLINGQKHFYTKDKDALFKVLNNSITINTWPEASIHTNPYPDTIPGCIPLLYIRNCNGKAVSACPNKEVIDFMRQLFNNSINNTGMCDYNSPKTSFTLGGRYRGVHTCSCRQMSTNVDYLLTGTKYVTNSLCVHYLEKHWDDVPKSERKKLEALIKV